ncbi:hypothetical protein HYU93_01100 [Candidatus Daviesbacteria bacterium]|nr:hypothetical protein [Candidatus Daviesbacteria bacterium]
MASSLRINLLPSEIIQAEIKRTKFYKIQAAGIVIILIMVFLASLTTVLRILQSRNITEVSAKVAQAEQQVSGFKNTQASLILLKDRLKIINGYFGVLSKQSLMYQLIEKLTPSSVVINAITVDKTGRVVFLALTPDSASLDELINNLTIKENNDGKISQVSVDSLNRGRDGLYRVSFKVSP